MKIEDPGAEVVDAATRGDLTSLDKVLVALQPGIYNLSVRMLGNRDDAADSTQEILLKVVTHLGGFRGESAFTTWVWSVARRHLLTARSRSAECPEVSLEGMAERLQAGIDFVASLPSSGAGETALTPEEKVAARQVAIGCTQRMLMTFSREQRLIYVLDTVFDLSSREAAVIVGVSEDAYRQRLSRTRARLHSFMNDACGLTNANAACRCETQVIALHHARASGMATVPALVVDRRELAEAEARFDAFTRVGDAAAVIRSHPQYQAPEAMRSAIRSVLTQEGFFDPRPLQ